MAYAHTLSRRTYRFDDLKTLLAKATPERSGDQLAGIAAASAEERMAARLALADLPLRTFLNEALVPYEADEVTRLVVDTHDAAAFAPVAHLTVGEWRDWLLAADTDRRHAGRARAGPDAGDGGRGQQADAQPGPGGRGAQMPRRHAAFATPRGCRGGWACGCSRTTRPTTCAASPRRWSTASSTAAATR